MASERSTIGRFFIGIWRFLDGTRKVVLNLVFFFFFFIFLFAVFASSESLVVHPNTALLLQPTGVVVEEYTSTPLDQAIQRASEGRRAETRLRDLVSAIRRARDDGRISVLVIDPAHLWGIGLSSLQELESALADFRESGKPVIAVGDMLGQQQYYLASLADEVWLNPEGLVWLDGYAVYRNYYREALEKLSVEVNLFRAGDYKSAGEPYVRDDMSPEAREANAFWLGGLWQQYLEGISRQRGIPLVDLSAAINEFPDRLEAMDSDFAALALEMGLVDRLIDQSQAYRELAQRSAPASNGHGFRQISVEDYLLATQFQQLERSKSKVAVVIAQGEIVQGDVEQGMVGSETMLRRLRAIAQRNDVAAVVMRIDSPGGDAFASEKIRSELQSLRDAGKTVVVSMGDVAASGGYWIAMAADEVWASPSTITGSIGVFGMAPRFHRSLDRLGIHSDGVGTTPLAGQFSLARPLEPGVARIYENTVQRIYEDFIAVVSEARQLPPEEVHAVAKGRVWSGTQAMDRGLVDHTGTLQQAIDAAGRIAGLGSDFTTEYEETELSAVEIFLLELAGGVAARFGVASDFRNSLPGQFLHALERDFMAFYRPGIGLNVASHCLCSVK